MSKLSAGVNGYLVSRYGGRYGNGVSAPNRDGASVTIGGVTAATHANTVIASHDEALFQLPVVTNDNLVR